MILTAETPAMAEAERLDRWEWLVAAIVDEAAGLAQGERAALAGRILKRAGYEQADEGGSLQERRQLAVRIAARLADPGE